MNEKIKTSKKIVKKIPKIPKIPKMQASKMQASKMQASKMQASKMQAPSIQGNILAMYNSCKMSINDRTILHTGKCGKDIINGIPVVVFLSVMPYTNTECTCVDMLTFIKNNF